MPERYSTRPTVLVVDDDQDVRELCAEALRESSFETRMAASAEEALAAIAASRVDIVLTDLRMPGIDGIELLRRIKEDAPEIDVVLMTGFATVPNAVEAMRLGAYDYITKPFHPDELTALLGRLTQQRDLALENRLLREQMATERGLGEMVGDSAVMQQLYRLLLKIAPKRHPVLITGESGTGKELIARAIHAHGPAPNEPFVPVDCAALSPQLIESELFGHVRGAFTGAVRDREGLLASARQGTIFLDEIGELPIELQSRLLRSLQEREMRPVGGNRSVPLRARILAATNRDLVAAAKEGKFREDLYFRLNVFSLAAPPLRDRPADIPLLAQHFIERHRTPSDSIRSLSPRALDLLVRYQWPGNARELENYIRRAIAVSSGASIQPEDLPEHLRSHDGAEPAPPGPLDRLERDAIARTLESTGGDRIQAARLLGIGKTTIYRKLKEYGIES